MLYWLLQKLSVTHSGAVPWGLGFRVLMAGLTAWALSILLGGRLIRLLKRMQFVEDTAKTPIEDALLRREIEQKSGTPTMGGAMVIAAWCSAALLWADPGSRYLYLGLSCVAALAALGFADDWLKLKGKTHRDRGLKARFKLLVQGLLGCTAGAVLWLWSRDGGGANVKALLPPVQQWAAYVPALFAVWVGIVMTVMSNATNVTDGLDGLMVGLAALAAAVLGVACWGVARGAVPSVHAAAAGGAGEMGVFCSALAGACLGFLWYNRHPARVFMGDVGALAVGGGLGLAAVICGMELLLAVVAFVFLAELGSSLAQIFAFKLTGKRILPIAPLHHMFQGKRWREPEIVSGFYAVGAVCAVGGIALMVLLS